MGIVRLLSKGTYSAVYPLHDGRYDKDGPNGEKCARRVSMASHNINKLLFVLERPYSTIYGYIPEI